MPEPLAVRRLGVDLEVRAARAQGRISCPGRGCSACCGLDVLVTEEELWSMLPHVPGRAWARVGALRGLHGADAVDHRTPCPLLDGDGSCSVYAHRPIHCRAYAVDSDPELCGTGSVEDISIATAGPRCAAVRGLRLDEHDFLLGALLRARPAALETT